MTPDDPRHGSTAGYNEHSNTGVSACGPCRRAAARYENQLRLERLTGRPRRTVSAVGTSRRIQALACMGYTFGEIAAEIGVSHDMVQKWCHRASTAIVRRGTAERVAVVFDALCMTPAPETTGREKWRRSYARTTARKHGWLPPLAWDDIDNDPEPPACSEPVDVDEVVVQRILDGDWRLAANHAERVAVLTQWRDTGRPMNELERLTGWNISRIVTALAAATDTPEAA